MQPLKIMIFLFSFCFLSPKAFSIVRCIGESNNSELLVDFTLSQTLINNEINQTLDLYLTFRNTGIIGPLQYIKGERREYLNKVLKSQLLLTSSQTATFNIIRYSKEETYTLSFECEQVKWQYRTDE